MEIRTRYVHFTEENRWSDADHDEAAKRLANRLRLDIPSLLRDCGVGKALAALAARQGRRNACPAMATNSKKEEVLVWAAAVVQKKKRRTDWEKIWVSGTGKSWKALKEFPERIRKMAKELETLRRSTYFGYENTHPFWSVPSYLSGCADWLKFQIETMATPTNRARRWQPHWVVHLSRRVKALTGHFCDKEVAQLLNAVNVALNGEGDPNKGFDGQTIALLRSRQKRKTRKT